MCLPDCELTADTSLVPFMLRPSMRMRMMKILDSYELTTNHTPSQFQASSQPPPIKTNPTTRRCDSRNLNLSPFCSLSSKSPLLKWQPTVIVFTIVSSCLIFVIISTILLDHCKHHHNHINNLHH